MRLVIVGPPNVGKSSLLNRLAGRETAIVTDIAGTTRDLVRDSIQLDGMPLHIIDTAGLRDTADPVEQEGIRRTHEALQTADAVLLLEDDRSPPGSEAVLRADLPSGINALVIRNKCDLSGNSAGFADEGVLRLSAKTGAGLGLLRDRLKQYAGFQDSESGAIIARRRHLDALERVQKALELAAAQAEAGHSELIAEELRQSQRALSEITGEISSEDLLDQIFSGFCVGK
jgi:tRNA modification GTPase